jgi:phasin family protein
MNFIALHHFRDDVVFNPLINGRNIIMATLPINGQKPTTQVTAQAIAPQDKINVAAGAIVNAAAQKLSQSTTQATANTATPKIAAKPAAKTASKTASKQVASKTAAKTATTTAPKQDSTATTSGKTQSATNSNQLFSAFFNPQLNNLMNNGAFTMNQNLFNQQNADQVNNFIKQNIEASIQSLTIFSKCMEDVSKAVFAFNQNTMNQTLAASKSILACKNAQEAFNAQNDAAKTSMDAALKEASKISQLATEAANKAWQPLQNRLNTVIETSMTAATNAAKKAA